MTGKSLKIIFIGAIVGLVVAVAALQQFPGRERGGESDEEYLLLLRKVMGVIGKSYLEPVDEKKLLRGAINGMLASLDPHSVYLPADSFKEMEVSTTGSFGGVGLEITVKEGRLTVISPIEGTPAGRGGIKSGDHIALIDGLPTRDLTIGDAVKRMRGPQGSRVTLTLLRKGADKPLVIPLVREIIQVKSLRFRTLEPGYGYLRIMQFQSRTGADLTEALEQLRKENGGSLRGLILDLRNNPGGLLDQAVSVANHFVGQQSDNSLIVSTRGREKSSSQEFMATIGVKEPPYPIVLLINGGSASASEIIAGCLQDHGRAVIMGTQSFGKGSVQSIIGLPHNGGLLLTTGKYYTPKGRSIQAKGITPDIVVDDLVMDGKSSKETTTFREKDLDNHLTDGATAPSAPLPPESPKSPAHSLADDRARQDYQLQRGVDLLKGWDLLRKAVKKN